MVLKAEVVADNGKRCKHCISKGWKGLNHTEDECRNKKKEMQKQAKKAEAEAAEAATWMIMVPKVGGKEGELEECDLVEEFFQRIQDPVKDNEDEEEPENEEEEEEEDEEKQERNGDVEEV